MRKFEKVSLKEYEKYKHLYSYDDVCMPKRQTPYSCGYDFTSPYDVVIKPHSTSFIYTSVKATMEDDEFLMLVIRSSLGIKEGLVLSNQVAIIDKDYYNNESNDGHIGVSIRNLTDSEKIIKKGDRFCQGIFLKYNKVIDDEPVKKARSGGYGSTGN